LTGAKEVMQKDHNIKLVYIGAGKQSILNRTQFRPYVERHRWENLDSYDEKAAELFRPYSFDLFLLNDAPPKIYNKWPIQTDFSVMKRCLYKLGLFLKNQNYLM
jgi:hypothetical protein